MRFYILFDSDASTIKRVTDSLSTIGDFQCLAIVKSADFKTHEILKFSPELIIINLDNFGLASYGIIEKLNKALGFPPAYIGITSSLKKRIEAFKKGFTNVIDQADDTEINKAISHYKATQVPNKFYCVSYYNDFQYLILTDIIFLKADGYATEFFMNDGSILTNYKTLKHCHQQLPFNFQRIHNSYVINCYHVRRIHVGKGEIYLRNFQKPLPLSKSYLGNLTEVKKLLIDPRNPTIR